MSSSDVQIDLADSAFAGVYPIHADDRPGLLAAARDCALVTLDIDLHECTDKAGLLRQLARALKFPAGFGHNWDALVDCLRDLSWLPGPGYLLMLRSVQGLRDAAEQDVETLVDILADSAEEWAEREVPFLAFIVLGEDEELGDDATGPDHAEANGVDASAQVMDFQLDDEYVELNQLLKLVGLCDSGGAGKVLVASGVVSVDGVQELRKTCKVRAGQIVSLGDALIRVQAAG